MLAIRWAYQRGRNPKCTQKKKDLGKTGINTIRKTLSVRAYDVVRRLSVRGRDRPWSVASYRPCPAKWRTAPPGTLARTLLDDFVLGNATRKEYRLQQHVKQAFSDEQLESFYEDKLQELAESGKPWPSLLPPELNPKAEEFLEDPPSLSPSMFQYTAACRKVGHMPVLLI